MQKISGYQKDFIWGCDGENFKFKKFIGFILGNGFQNF